MSALGDLKRGAFSRDEDEQLRERWLCGERLVDIAKHLNRTPDSVKRRRADLKLPARRPGRPPAPRRDKPRESATATAAKRPWIVPPASEEEQRRLINAFIDSGKMQICPPAYVAPVTGADETTGRGLTCYQAPDWHSQKEASWQEKLARDRARTSQRGNDGEKTTDARS